MKEERSKKKIFEIKARKRKTESKPAEYSPAGVDELKKEFPVDPNLSAESEAVNAFDLIDWTTREPLPTMTSLTEDYMTPSYKAPSFTQWHKRGL